MRPRIYKRVCPSVRRSVLRSVRRSVWANSWATPGRIYGPTLCLVIIGVEAQFPAAFFTPLPHSPSLHLFLTDSTAVLADSLHQQKSSSLATRDLCLKSSLISRELERRSKKQKTIDSVALGTSEGSHQPLLTDFPQSQESQELE